MFWRMFTASLRARRGRLGLALVAVTLGVTVSTALATLAIQVGDDLSRALRAAGPNFVVVPAGARLPLDLGGAEVIPPRAGLALADSSIRILKGFFWKHNVLEAAPELSVTALIEDRSTTLIGTWFDREIAVDDGPWRTGVTRLRPHWEVEGRWPSEAANELVLARNLAARLGVEPGRPVRVSALGRTESWLVSGVVAARPGEAATAWAPLEAVQRLEQRDGQLDRIWLSALVVAEPNAPPPDASDAPEAYERYMCTAYPRNLANELAAEVPNSEVLLMSEVLSGEGAVVNRLNMLMVLLGLAAITASVLGLFSTSMATVVERGVELGLLRAIGATSRQIAGLLLSETVLIALLGGGLGWLLGSAGAAAIRGQAFGSPALAIPLLLPAALVVALVVSWVGTIAPIRAAMRLDPAEVLRG